MRRLALGLVRIRFVFLVIALIIFAVAYPVSRQVRMDRSISAMFDPDDDTFRDYAELQAAFGGNAVAIVVYRDANLLSPEGFQRSANVTQRIETVSGVKGVLSPSVLSELVAKVRPAGFLTGFSNKVPALMRKRDSVARGIDDLFQGYTHSEDHSRAAVVAMLDPEHPPETIESIKEIGASLPRDYPEDISEVSIVGEPVLVHDGFALIERDGAQLATMTVVLLSIVVLISLVDLRFILLSAGVIVWSLTLTRAAMVWFDLGLSLVSTILTAIVTVIAVASVLHLGVRFRIARNRGFDQHRSTVRSIALLLLPILWTCATDAAGFAALRFSRIAPVQDFGLIVALAAVFVFIAVVLLAPSVMMIPNVQAGKKLHQMQRTLARRIRRGCLRVASSFVNNKRLGVAITIALVIVSILGVWKSETETSFLKNFRSDSPIVMDYDRVEHSFGGAGVWDVVIDAPDSPSKKYLAHVLAMEAELRSIRVAGDASLSKVISLADAVDVVGRARTLRYLSPTIRLRGMRLVMPVFVDALLTPKGEGRRRQLRIMLRSSEHLTASQKTSLITEVERIVSEFTSGANWNAFFVTQEPTQQGTVTGYYVMMSRLVSQLIQDQWRCFVASSILIWILLLMATRSWRLATAALLPNLLPVFFVLAVVGLSGQKINMGAAMIAAVSIGLSIDGSVHFLASYRRHRDDDHSQDVSASHAAGNVGVPVMLATVALVVGFSVLATSDFVPTATFGMLVAITLAAGTFINLTLLPAFVSRVDR